LGEKDRMNQGLQNASLDHAAMERLAVQVVRDFATVCAKLKDVRQPIETIQSWFRSHPRGSTSLLGCATFKEFCEKKLHRHESTVYRMLGNSRAMLEAKRADARRRLVEAANAAFPGPEGCGNKIGPHECCTCVCGDADKLLPGLPMSSVAAVITDAPYGLDSENWDGKVPYHLLPRFLQITDGPVLWFGAAPAICEACKSFDPEPERVLIWTPSFTHSHVMANGLAYRYHPLYAWRLPKQHDGPSWDVLNTPTEGGSNWWRHPCTKPLALMEQLCGIARFGGVVLDPFAGSGTTLLAARNRGRHFLGFEINPAYCDVIAQRLGASGSEGTGNVADGDGQRPLGLVVAPELSRYGAATHCRVSVG
jgi:hypothetical protein